MIDDSQSPMKMGTPAVYRILVQGAFHSDWQDRIGDLQLRETTNENGQAQTLLHGPILDQAQLSGVLNLLYDLRMPLLRLECLDSEESVEEPETSPAPIGESPGENPS